MILFCQFLINFLGFIQSDIYSRAISVLFAVFDKRLVFCRIGTVINAGSFRNRRIQLLSDSDKMRIPVFRHISVSIFYIPAVRTRQHRTAGRVCICKVNALIHAFFVPDISDSVTHQNDIFTVVCDSSIRLQHFLSSCETCVHIGSSGLRPCAHKFSDDILCVFRQWCQRQFCYFSPELYRTDLYCRSGVLNLAVQLFKHIADTLFYQRTAAGFIQYEDYIGDQFLFRRRQGQRHF